MSLYRNVVLVVLASLLCSAGVAQAQDSRAEVLRQARLDKQQTLQPYDTKPIERVLRKIEREGLLVGRDGFYPKIGSLTTGSGFAYGIGYRTTRLFGGEGHLELWAGASATRYWATEARLRVPALAEGRVMLEAWGRRHQYPREDYFGLGPASLRRNETNYNLLANFFGVRAGVRPAKRILTLGGGLELLQPRIGNGKDDRLPSIREVFDEQSTPGLLAQPDFVRSSAFVDVDWRRPLNARKGGWYRAEFSHYRDRDLGAYTFNRLDLDLRQFASFLGERRVLFGRVFASTSDRTSGQHVPFYFMPTLGGNDSLRGHRDYRFRGPHALLVQGEYRFEIWSGLDGALFYDTGKVGLRRTDLNLKNLQSDYGFGFRFNTDNGVVLRVDTALGSRDGKHLWIVFGGTF